MPLFINRKEIEYPEPTLASLSVKISEGVYDDLHAMVGYIDEDWLARAILNWEKVRIGKSNRRYKDVLFLVKGPLLVSAGFEDSPDWGLESSSVCAHCNGRGYLVFFDSPNQSEEREDANKQETQRRVRCWFKGCRANRERAPRSNAQWQPRKNIRGSVSAKA